MSNQSKRDDKPAPTAAPAPKTHTANGTAPADEFAGYDLLPTQRRLMLILRDGQPHTSDELLKCLRDDLATKPLLRTHISLLRNKLLPHGKGVLIQVKTHRLHYRLVNLIST